MSALAVYLERTGIATSVIGLVHLHLRRVAPPRALWVPFELGRPLGPPNKPMFQRAVLRSALQLLEDAQEPGTLIEFADEDPSQAGDPQWTGPAAGATGLIGEVARLRAHYARAMAASGDRTTVGLSGLAIDAAAQYVERFIKSGESAKPQSPHSALALLRFACDDIKAYYLEAAASAGLPSSNQLNGWFWHKTHAGNVIRALREACVDGGGRGATLLGGSLVPRAYL